MLVIPGNVGYLKQFFSAQLFVANGAPAGARLVLRNVNGTLRMPAGDDHVLGTADDPLALPELLRDGQTIVQPLTMDVRHVGPDGQPGTADDRALLNPGEQGQAEFLIRGEREGFHTIDFDIQAVLDGLPVGPVTVKGKASGGVLVRNPFFDVTFTLPSVVRRGELFKAFVTVTNIGQGLANDVNVTLDAARMSGVTLVSDPTQRIDTLAGGDSATLAFTFRSQRTGQAVATYLRFDGDGATGNVNFTVGIGDRGVPLSPDTLVLPSSVDALHGDVVEAALRVLGQAWSVAAAPSGTLPSGVIRTSRTVVLQKALVLAEAGLRVTLGETEEDALSDLLFDYYAGTPVDPGFEQVLRETEAGRDFARAAAARIGELAPGAVSDPNAFERRAAEVALSTLDFVSFAVGGPPGLRLTLKDAAGHVTTLDRDGSATPGAVKGALLMALGDRATGPAYGLIGAPAASPYSIEIVGPPGAGVTVSVTLPRGDGTFVHGDVSASLPETGYADVTIDLSRPDVLEFAPNVRGGATPVPFSTSVLASEGPRLVSANVIGPETFDGASPFGFQAVLVFDRVVDAASAADRGAYTVPHNEVRSARRQLSGRLVFLTLTQPEGNYIPTTIGVRGLRDARAQEGPAIAMDLPSRIHDPGAVVSGRVIYAGGQPVTGATVVYSNQVDYTCLFPNGGGLAAVPVAADGSYEFRYVRQDNCGYAFTMTTQDPGTGARRDVTHFVRAAGEQIVLDIALFARGSVTGTVRDLSGHPVPGAQVVALSQTDSQSGGAAVTDADGHYAISGITVGPVTVRAAKDASVGHSSGRIDHPQVPAVVDLTLDGGSVRVSGTVRKLEDGLLAPIPGIDVVYSVGGLAVGVTKADQEGRYTFDGMPTGSFVVSASLTTQDHGSTSGAAAGGESLTGIDILIAIRTAAQFGTVSGVVRFPDGAPAHDAIVSINGRGVLSGVDGSFVIRGVEVQPGRVQQVTARTRDGLRSGSRDVIVDQPDQVVSGVAITLSGLGSVEFQVLGPGGEPLPDQAVGLLGLCSDPCGCGARKTGPDGKVRFDNLPLGRYDAQAIAGSGSRIDAVRGSATITRDGATGAGVLRFGGFGSVSGIVFDPDGRPSFGADVQLTALRFVNDGLFTCGLVSGLAQRARTPTSGRFSFGGINLGPIAVTASQDFSPTPVGVQDRLVADGQNIPLELHLVNTTAGELSGTVYLPDGVTRAPAGVEVTANGSLPDVTVRTTANGEYHFAKIFPEGGYTVTVRDPVTGGLARAQVFLRTSVNATHDFRLKGKGTVVVRVVDGDDQPVSSAFVRVTETEFPGNVHESALEPASQGLATLEGVFEGPIGIDVSDSFARGGRASSVVGYAGARVEVKVRLATTGIVNGHFRKRDRVTPIPFGIVKLIQGYSTLGQTTTLGSGDVGAFSFDFVPAGDVRLEGQDPLTGRTAVALGTITENGQVVTLDLIAQGLGTVRGTVTRTGGTANGIPVEVSSGGFKATTLTDGTGLYTIDGVPEGNVTVTANTGGGFLAGTATGKLVGDGAVLTLNVALRATGSVAGQVRRADGVTAGPISSVSVQVGGPGGGAQSTVTDAEGRFSFDRVPTGTATLSARPLDSIDFGSKTVAVTEGATADGNIVLNGVGRVLVRVRSSTGQMVAGAHVSVSSDADFSRPFTSVTNSAGEALLAEVWAGHLTVNAWDPATGLSGTAPGPLADGALATVVVDLQQAGRVVGRVSHHDGSPAAGFRVQLAGRGTFTDGAGEYAIDNVPLGEYGVNADDPLGNDFGGTTVRLLVGGATVRGDITLNGLGSVRVTVTDAGGAHVPDAEATAISAGRSVSGRTGSDGVALLVGVPAGETYVSAYDPVRNVRGSTTITLPADVLRDVTVTLAPVDHITGRVLAPNGTDPVAGAVVSTYFRGSTVSAPDGSFSLENLPPGLYDVRVSVDGRYRALVNDVTAPSTIDLVIGGIGQVEGTVRTPSGTPAVDAAVTLDVIRADHFFGFPDGFRAHVTTRTDSAGRYVIADIAAGTVKVSAADAGGNRADGGGTVRDAETTTIDLDLLSSAVTLPVTLTDGNGFPWEITESGVTGIQTSYYSCYGVGGLFCAPDPEGGAPRLSIVRDGTVTPFTGAGAVAASRNGKREIVIRQEGLAGLDVTRKVYVPGDGYFTRYLETLENPGPDPVTVDLVEQVYLSGSYGRQSVVDSSSGDAAADASDRWIVLDDDKPADAYLYVNWPSLSSNTPALGVVMADATGLAPSAVEWQPVTATASRVTYRWDGIVVPPGGRVSVLHAITPQGEPGRAHASAERVDALPPEMLDGLTGDEAASVVNFAVPADLASTVPSLPPNDGTVVGRVLAGDGQTPLCKGIKFQSRSPYYGEVTSTFPSFPCEADDSGFLVQHLPDRYNPDAHRAPVPRGPFTVTTSGSSFQESRTLVVEGDFPSTGVMDLTSAAGRTLRFSTRGANVVPEDGADFSTRTVWRWATGDSSRPPYYREPWFEVAFPQEVTVREIRFRGVRGPFYWYDPDPNLTRARFEVRDAAGAVLWMQEVDLPEPNRDIDVDVPGVGGARSVRLVDLADDIDAPAFADLQVIGEGLTSVTGWVQQDAVFHGTGVIVGHMRRADGSAAPRGYVELRRDDGRSEYDSADEDGAFQLVLIPPGTYQLFGYFFESTVAVGTVTVTADQRIVQDVVFPALGGVHVTVQRASGDPTYAQLQLTGPNGFQRFAGGGTYLFGEYTFPDMPPGTYSLLAMDTASGATITRTVVVPAGPPVEVPVVFPPRGTVDVTVTQGGLPVQGAQVEWQSDSRGPRWVSTPCTSFCGPFTTGLLGNVRLGEVVGPAFRVRVYYPGQPLVYREASGTLTVDDETVALAVDLPALETVSGTVTGIVRYPTGAVAVNVMVRAVSEDGRRQSSVPTNASGRYSLVAPAGSVRVQAWLDQYGAGSPLERAAVVTAGATSTLDLDPPGAIRQPGASEGWRVNVPVGTGAGANVNVYLEGAPVGLGALFDPYLEVYDQDGTLLGANNDYSPQNRNSQLSLVVPSGHALTLVARGNGAATGGYRFSVSAWDRGSSFDPRYFSEVLPLRWIEDGTATGRVTYRPSGAPAAGQRVRVVDARFGFIRRLTTDADGRYAAGLPVGTFTVDVRDGEDVVLAQAAGEIHAVGDTATVDLSIAPHAPVTATVRRGPVVVPGLQVTLESDDLASPESDRIRRRTTDASGRVATTLPVGTITASTIDPATGQPASATGTLVAGGSLDLTLNFGARQAIVFGHVLGGSEAVPVSGAIVEIAGVGSTTSDATGGYRIENVPPGSYVVKARTATGDRSTSINVGGGDIALDLVLFHLRGRVTESDGRPVAGAAVQLCSSSYPFTCIPATAGDDGRYVYIGIPEAVFPRGGFSSGLLRANPPDTTFVNTARSLFLSNSGFSSVIDLVLPPTGSVAGTVREAGGAAVPGATVTLLTSWGGPLGTATTDESGHYRMAHVFPQEAVAQADADGVPSAPVETLVSAGQETTVDLTLVPTARLDLGVQDGQGALVAAYVELKVIGVPGYNFYYPWSRAFALFDDEGVARRVTARVPAGPFRVLSRNGEQSAAEEGVLAGDESRTITLTPGTHVQWPTRIGAFYDYAADESGCEPCGGFASTRSSTQERELGVARPEPGGRTFTSLTHYDVRGLQIRWRKDVAVSGTFTRTLTFVRNPGPDPVTVSLESAVAGVGHVELLTTSSGDATFDAGDTWAALLDGETPRVLVPGAITSGYFQRDQDGEGGFFPGRVAGRHELTIPPGETRALLAFAVWRADGDQALIIATAESLASLTNPEALAGLTDAERSAVVNFTVPPAAVITGVVLDPSAAPVPGARLGAVAQGAVAAEALADANGHFSFDTLSEGAYSVVAYDPAALRPGRADVAAVAGSTVELTVHLLADDALGAVRVTGQWVNSGEPAAGAVAIMTVAGFSPFWPPAVTLDTAGQAQFGRVPAGQYAVGWRAPNQGDAAVADVTAGSVTDVTLTLTQLGIALPYDLAAPGIRYSVQRDGPVWVDDSCSPSCGPQSLLGWQGYPSAEAAALRLSGREVATGPFVSSGLRVTRRVYVPPSGRFVRFVDVIENPGPDDVGAFFIDNTSGYTNGDPWAVYATSSGDTEVDLGDGYVVATAPGTRPFAFVNHGAAPAVLPSSFSWSVWEWIISRTDYWDPVPIPAGGRVLLVRFEVIGAEGQEAAVRDEAEALWTLADTEALAGLTAEERADIVNFTLP